MHILRILYRLFTGFIKLITYSYINIFKNMFKINREIGPPVLSPVGLVVEWSLARCGKSIC